MEHLAAKRSVIFHYHLFKNAGTSLDALLIDYFKDKWVTQEFSGQHAINRQEVKSWIESNPEALCFSSHTAHLPTAQVAQTEVLPVIFVRHPLDRIASAYSFERKQGSDGFGSVLARNTTLAGYIETRLSLPHDFQCRNFHVANFARMFPANTGDELTRALRAVKELPFVGIVEQFGDSLTKLDAWLETKGFSNMNMKPVEKNVSRDLSQPIETRIAEIKSQVGDEVFQKLLTANEADMALYNAALAKSTANETSEL